MVDLLKLPSWNHRPQEYCSKNHSSSHNISGYSAHDLLGGARGLSVVLLDIAESGEMDGIARQDLLYVSERLTLIMCELEHRLRTRDEYNAKPSLKGKRKKKESAEMKKKRALIASLDTGRGS